MYSKRSRPLEDKALKILEGGARFKYISSKSMDLYARLVSLYLINGDKEGRDMALKKMSAI